MVIQTLGKRKAAGAQNTEKKRRLSEGQKLIRSQFTSLEGTKGLSRTERAEIKKELGEKADKFRKEEKNKYKDQMGAEYHKNQIPYAKFVEILFDKSVQNIDNKAVINEEQFKKEILKIIYPEGYKRPEYTDTELHQIDQPKGANFRESSNIRKAREILAQQNATEHPQQSTEDNDDLTAEEQDEMAIKIARQSAEKAKQEAAQQAKRQQAIMAAIWNRMQRENAA